MTADQRDPGDILKVYTAKMRSLAPWSGGVVVILLLVGLLLFASLKYVPAGHVGVLVFFGRVTDTTLSAGTHLANPLARNITLSVRTQELTERAQVLSNEGLSVTLDTTLLFRLDSAKANEVYKSIGVDYVDIVVKANLRSTIRSVTSAYDADALYGVKRELIGKQVSDELEAILSGRGIIVERVLLREVKLPATVTQAIEAKQQADQEAQRMEFVLQREQQEAERKRIEAAGIRDFQRIVAQGISAQLLTWKGIEATEALASSQNAKVVIIGSGDKGLPIILGGQ